MTIFTNSNYGNSPVTLRQPDFQQIDQEDKINDTNLEWKSWRERAKSDNSIYYFSVYSNDNLVGEIFLHDINEETKEALVGYRIFDSGMRGKEALLLLQRFVKENTDLKTLIIITAENNLPSIKMAERCGFTKLGTSRENKKDIVLSWKRNLP